MIAQHHINYNLEEIDTNFLDFLSNIDASLCERLIAARNDYNSDHLLPDLPTDLLMEKNGLNSEELIALSVILEQYLSNLFGTNPERDAFILKSKESKKFYEIKRNFIHRHVAKKYKRDVLDQKSIVENFAKKYSPDSKIISDEDFIALILQKNITELDPLIEEYAACRLYFGPASPLFSKPELQDFDHLINFEKSGNVIYKTQDQHTSHSLGHPGSDISLLESNYCIKCHKQNKDTCSSGIASDSPNDKSYNPLGNKLTGCPLNIKISEMIDLYGAGHVIGALSIAMESHPLIALTGKRICNDCSKACIFQKQIPVDVPLIESEILKTVLNFKFGFEIYYLLTQWNPLKTKNYLPDYLPSNSNKSKVLVVGSGPAGIALSYYLLRSGCSVAMIDGMKIEKLDHDIINKPIESYNQITSLYQSIKPQGFGGVCESGITDRWNKENLIIMRIILERNKAFTLQGGTKYGANITYEDAMDLGFDHIALACGAGKPNIPSFANMHLGGINFASDFLMSIGTGDISNDDNPNIYNIDLPAYVIGGGLTSIDCAVEAIKYYPTMIKKMVKKTFKNEFKNSVKNLDHESHFNDPKLARLIKSHQAIEAEEHLALSEKRAPNYKQVIQKLGGVYLCYRGKLEQSPAYRINHEELDIALSEGIQFIENAEIIAANPDESSKINSVTAKIGGKLKELECRSLFIASGTGHIRDYAKPSNVSFWGDMDKNYEGSVVKAIASSKDGYKTILKSIASAKLDRAENIHNDLKSYVRNIRFLNENLFELKIENKLAARNFQIGQFFKVEIYKTTTEESEPIALLGARSANDIITFYVEINGNSTRQLSKINMGAEISLTGPLGKTLEGRLEGPLGVYLEAPTPKASRGTLQTTNQSKNQKYLLLTSGPTSFAFAEYARQLAENDIEVELHVFCQPRSLESQDIEIYRDNISKITDRVRFYDEINECRLGSDYTKIYISGSYKFMKEASNKIKHLQAEKFLLANTLMQCMMGGVCGRCALDVNPDVTQDINHDINQGLTPKLEFMCLNPIKPLSDKVLEALELKLTQNIL